MTTIVDLSSVYGLLLVSGDKARTFLQGQLSHDLTLLTYDNPLWAAYCTVQGRVIALLRVYEVDGMVYLRVRRDLLETVQVDLQKYAAFSQVTLTDVSAKYPLYAVQSAEPNLGVWQDKYSDQTLVFGASLCPTKSIEHWDQEEINDFIPEIYPATTALFLPQHLNLHTLPAISFTKGCYRGQEIIARLSHRGKLKKTLFKIRSQQTLQPGEPLYHQKILLGHVVRVTTLHHTIGLAVLSLSKTPHTCTTDSGKNVEVLI